MLNTFRSYLSVLNNVQITSVYWTLPYSRLIAFTINIKVIIMLAYLYTRMRCKILYISVRFIFASLLCKIHGVANLSGSLSLFFHLDLGVPA